MALSDQLLGNPLVDNPLQETPDQITDRPEDRGLIANLGLGVTAGAIGAVDETINTAVEIAEWTTNVFKSEEEHVDWDWKEVRGDRWFDESFGAGGDFAKSVTKFGIGMVGLGKLKVLTKFGKIGAGLIKGATTDFVMSSQEEGLLTDFIADMNRDEYGEVSNSILAYMAGDDDESDLTFKLKATLEGAFLGVALESAIGAYKGIAKLGKEHVKNASGGDRHVADSIIERVGGNASRRNLDFEETLTGSSTNFNRKVHQHSSDKVVKDNVDKFEGLTTSQLTKRFVKVDTDVPTATYLEAMSKKDPNSSIQTIINQMTDEGLWTESAERGTQMIDEFAELFAKSDVGVESHAVLNKEMGFLDRTLFKGMSDDVEGLSKAGRKDLAVLKAQTVKQRYYAMTEVRMQDNLDVYLHKGANLTDDDMLQFEAKLMEYANIEPVFAEVRAQAGRLVKARDLRYKSLYTVDGEAVETLSEQLLDQLKKTRGDQRELKNLLGEMRKYGSVKNWLKEGGKEQHPFMKWVDGYSAFRHQNMLSGWKTGITNTLSTASKIGLDQNIAPLLAGITTGDSAQIRQSLYSVQTFWSNFSHTFGKMQTAFGDVSGDDWFQKVGNLLDTNTRNKFIEQSKTISRLSREGADEVANTSARLGLKGTKGGTLLDWFVNMNSIPSTFTTSIPDLLQGNASFYSAVDGLVARDLIGPHMSAEAKRNLRANVQDLAERYMEGSAKELPASVPPEWGARLAGIFEEAVQGSREALFQQGTGSVQGLVNWMKNIENPYGRAFASTIFPFVSTPVNIANTILEMTPVLGNVSQKVRKELAMGGAIKAQREAKQMVGAMLYSSGAMLAMSGRLTGSHPKGDREALKAGGILENAVKIGDTWFELQRADPFGSFLTLMANTVQAVSVTDAGTNESAIMTLVNGIGESTLSKTYMKGAGDLWNAINEPDRYLEPFLQNYATSLIPVGSLQKSINQAVDPMIKESHDFIDRINQYTVGRSGQAPARLDTFGYEVGEESLMSTIFGIRTHSENPHVDPRVLSEMIATRTMPANREGSLDNVKLTKEEAYEAKLNMASGGAYKKLSHLVNSPSYRLMTLGDRQSELRKLVGQIRGEGREKMRESNVTAKARHRKLREEMARISNVRKPVGEAVTNLDFIEARLSALPQEERLD